MRPFIRKLVIGAPILVIAWFVFNLCLFCYQKWQTERQIRAITNEQLPHFKAFLKSGMERYKAEDELSKRSISFEPARDDSYGRNDFILIKRLPSLKFYCSFEDVGAKLIFDPTRQTLTDVEISGQLMDCL